MANTMILEGTNLTDAANDASRTILQLHNVSLIPGGADSVMDNEAELLRSHGHRVLRYVADNRQIPEMSKAAVAAAALWNQQAVRDVERLIRDERPDVVHVHNTFPILSPAVIRVAHRHGIPVLQTLHSYRLSCLNGLFYREGAICEKCIGHRVAWPGIVHGCYKESRAASAVIASALALHRGLGTYHKQVDAYLALTEFAKGKLVESGYPEERILVKPNFVHDGLGRGDGAGKFALFVGRFTPEKGVQTLVEAWKHIGDRMSLKVVGDGPLRGEIEQTAASLPGIEFLGWRPKEDVARLMCDAACLVFPSQWYEGLPMVILVAFSAGTPVIVSDVGNFCDVIEPEKTGLWFRNADASDLADKVLWLLAHRDRAAQMRELAYQTFREKYSAEANYACFQQIFARVLSSRQPTEPAGRNT